MGILYMRLLTSCCSVGIRYCCYCPWPYLQNSISFVRKRLYTYMALSQWASCSLLLHRQMKSYSIRLVLDWHDRYAVLTDTIFVVCGLTLLMCRLVIMQTMSEYLQLGPDSCIPFGTPFLTRTRHVNGDRCHKELHAKPQLACCTTSGIFLW